MTDVPVFQISELPLGTMRAVKIGNKNVVLFRGADGQLSALEDRCSHAEVKLSGGSFDGSEVTCPAHGARFDVCSGRQLCMPAVRGVKSFPVRVEGEAIFVTVS